MTGFSVCIPTLNAGSIWKELWASLQMQSLQPAEVIVVDSSSTDGTAEMARQAGCRVVAIRREDFRHGATRQLAADLPSASGILVYLTQDSILAESNALGSLVAAFDDVSVGAAYGRQLPRRGAGPIEAHARFFNYPPRSSVRSYDDNKTTGFKTIFFSNSFGAYRRSALREAGGFPLESNFGEDTVVIARMLQRKWRVAYVAEAKTYHSHGFSLREEFDRYQRIGELHQNESWLLREFGQASAEGRRFTASELRFLLRRAPWRIPEAGLRNGLKYVGYRRGRRTTEPHSG